MLRPVLPLDRTEQPGPLGLLRRAVIGWRLRRLAIEPIPVAQVSHRAEDELVRVQGRVKAVTTIGSFLHGIPAVYRHLRIDVVPPCFHDAAVDFDLEDVSGEEPIRVQVAGARFVSRPLPETMPYPSRFFDSRRVSPSLVALMARLRDEGKPVHAVEVVVFEGEEIEVVGRKSRVVDATTGTGVYRTAPERHALRSVTVMPTRYY